MTDGESTARQRREVEHSSIASDAGVPDSASIVPLQREESYVEQGDRSVVRSDVLVKLKSGKEQQAIVGPLIEFLISCGWSTEQMVFGKREWRVPQNPSEAHKRDMGQSFKGFPCDVAIFDSSDRRGDPKHLILIVETKVPKEKGKNDVPREQRGISQLETYMSLEPHTKAGVWVENADPSAPAIFVFRDSSGRLIRRNRLLKDIPRSGEPISADQKRLTFGDLTVPSEQAIMRAIKDLLDRVVVEDGNVTRREDQLDQLCNLLLLKLHSDRRAKLRPEDPPIFRPLESTARTGEEIRQQFQRLVDRFPETFITAQDREIRFSDATIHGCVERLYPYRMVDVGVSALATGFQVLRAAALRQKEGQYFTPQPVIAAGVKLLDIDLDDLVIDPACGTGGFLVESLLEMQERYPGNEGEIARWAQTNLFGIDKDSIGVKLTKAIMQIAGDGSAHCARGDSVRTHLWSSDYPHLNSGDFANGRFSVVVTNPPFGQNLTISAEDARLSGFDIAAPDGEYRELGIGLIFLQRAHQLLRVGGRVGIILPETYFFSPGYRFLFAWLKPRLVPKIVVNVPMEAFEFCRAKTNFYIFEKVA